MAGKSRKSKSEATDLPRPDEKALETIIRPELNIERWSIWQPTNARTPPRPKIIIRQVALDNGSRITSKVTVGYTHKGALTTFDQRVYYGLVRIWEEEGRSIGATNFSLRRLGRILKKSWGPNTMNALIKSLTRLRITPFTWENSFFDKEKGETLITTGDAFHILSELHIERCEKGKAIASEQARFRFGDKILKNLYANHTRPVCLDSVLSIDTDIGQLLYAHVDLRIYGNEKTRYERTTKELFFDDLALDGKAYENAANRKQKIERALRELLGLRLSDGIIVSATLERTKDGRDYKIIIIKAPLTRQAQSASENDGQKELREFTEEQETLLAKLRGYKVGEKRALEIVTKYPLDQIKKQLDALPHRDRTTIKNLSAYLIRAIEEDYELPVECLAQIEETKSKRKKEEQKVVTEACPFCQDSELPGNRRIFTNKQPNGSWKTCTHDPEVESKYRSADSRV